MSNDLRFAISSLVRRLTLVVGRGRVKQSDDSKAMQSLQVQFGPKEIMDLMRMQLGVVTWPPDGTDVIALFLSGDRSNGVVIGAHNLKGRFKLGAKGEVALQDYNGADGAAGKWIWAKKKAGAAPGGWEVEANGEPFTINNAKKVTINAGTDGAVLNTTGNVVFNMGGHDLTVANAGTVKLDNPTAVQLTGAGGRKVVCDGDPVTGGVVHANAGQKVTAT